MSDDDSPSCCVFYCDDEPPADILDDGIIKARKEHHCCECNDLIGIGTRHERTKLVDRSWSKGQISTYRTCLSCVEIRDHFARACNGSWCYGAVWEQIEENFFPDMKAGGPCMTGLSPAAKGRLFELRLAWLEATSPYS